MTVENAACPSAAAPGRLKLINAALRAAWRSGIATPPSLDPDLLVRKAARRANAQPDGDAVGWRSRLARLCTDLEEQARLSALGRTLAHGQLVAALATRFRAHALWRRHPEIADLPLSRPILIVGQMRSGSTRMQRLLACDRRLTFTRFFESWNPIPARDGALALIERELKARLGLTCARLLNPAFDSIHPTGWNAPDEEIGLQNASLFGTAFEAQWKVPNYAAAVEAEDGVAVYREFKRFVQTLAWLRRDFGDRPWVMKVPQFSQDLPALLRVFPDARIIWLQRDRSDVMASCASLVCNQMSLQSDHVDPLWVGREWSRKARLREERIEAAKASVSVPQVEVPYDAVSRTWEAEIERVYRMLQLPFADEVRKAMASYLRNARGHERSRHRYDGRMFGLASRAPA